MKHTIVCTTAIDDASAEQAWAVWSDLASYPRWDPREEINEPHGPLAVGTTGAFKQAGRGAGEYTIVALDPGRSWTSRTGLPGGRLDIEHEVVPSATGVELVKRYTAYGPMALAFRLFFARGIRAEMPSTFAALRAEIRHRTMHTSAQ